jgi:hypothetical protein
MSENKTPLDEILADLKSIRDKLPDTKFIWLFFDEDKASEEAKAKKLAAEIYKLLGDIEAKLAYAQMKQLSFENLDGLGPIKTNKNTGRPVKVRWCKNDKTYLGLYLGEVALSFSADFSKKEILEVNYAGHNPAILVLEIERVIYGCESWWGFINDEAELKDITDEDISNIPYVKALRGMSERECSKLDEENMDADESETES